MDPWIELRNTIAGAMLWAIMIGIAVVLIWPRSLPVLETIYGTVFGLVLLGGVVAVILDR